MGDVIGKCQRQIHAFSGTGRSRIDKYLQESATYAAAKARRNLKAEFVTSRAENGFLVWKESRTNGIAASFPIEVDEKSGVVRQLNQDVYGLLCDVFPCLHRKDAAGNSLPWNTASTTGSKEWAKPTHEEINMHDPTKTKFGTTVVGGNRIGQIAWRSRVAKLWKNQCPITQCKIENLLDGANILPHRKCTTDQSLDEQNGIFLATHLHKAFDRGPHQFFIRRKTAFF
ncbi:MAG: HNH endonuclease signature motif containing protein [Limisphaerales bacterium]